MSSSSVPPGSQVEEGSQNANPGPPAPLPPNQVPTQKPPPLKRQNAVVVTDPVNLPDEDEPKPYVDLVARHMRNALARPGSWTSWLACYCPFAMTYAAGDACIPLIPEMVTKVRMRLAHPFADPVRTFVINTIGPASTTFYEMQGRWSSMDPHFHQLMEILCQLDKRVMERTILVQQQQYEELSRPTIVLSDDEDDSPAATEVAETPDSPADEEDEEEEEVAQLPVRRKRN